MVRWKGPCTREKICRRQKNYRRDFLCSVVPRATPLVRKAVRHFWNLDTLELNAQTTRGVGIDYPRPKTIGADRLANSVAAFQRFGAPVVVVDFGTAVTFDVVNPKGNYAGGIIAHGLAAMTDYLHEKTALLPRIKITEPKSVIGKSTEQAMLAGAVYGYRGLVRELISELKRELKTKRLPVVATGGYAKTHGCRITRNFRGRTEFNFGRFAVGLPFTYGTV